MAGEMIEDNLKKSILTIEMLCRQVNYLIHFVP